MLHLLRIALPLALFLGSSNLHGAVSDFFPFFKKSNEAPYTRHFQYPTSLVFNAGTYALMEEGFTIAKSNFASGVILASKENLDVRMTFKDVPFWNQETTTVNVYITDFSADGAVYPEVPLYVSILNRMRQFLLS